MNVVAIAPYLARRERRTAVVFAVLPAPRHLSCVVCPAVIWAGQHCVQWRTRAGSKEACCRSCWPRAVDALDAAREARP